MFLFSNRSLKSQGLKKPHEILDRDLEWARLGEMWESGTAELVFMHGRRRVGKSWLLQRFARAVGGIYYQATRGTRSEQLARLNGVVGAHFDDPALKRGAGLPGWESLFEYVLDQTDGRRFFFAIDEFPYLLQEDPELASVLQLLWDHRWKEARFKLLLCGSHITLMRHLEEHDQPLHGRRTARIPLSPFTYREVAEFVPGYSPRDRLRTYGVFGGLPGYLDYLDPDRSLAENVGRLILDPSGRLHDEATHVLDAFGREAQVHYSTLFAIATGAHTWGKIKSKVDRSEGALWPVIEWLQEMELVEREVPVSKDRPRTSKVSLYRISDPYVRFWYRFVQPIYSAGSAALASPEALWKAYVEPELDTYMGEAFEDACRDFVRTALDLPFQPVRIGRWWTRDSESEVEIVVRGTQDELFVAECKWGPVGRKDLVRLRERGRRVAGEIGGVPRIHYGLFSGADEVDDSVRAAAADGELLYFGAGDLFPDE